MENYINSLNAVNKVKQPKPELSNEGSSGSEKNIKRPYVGIINTPKPTMTPLSDTIVIKKQQKPHIVYKLETKQNDFASTDNVAAIGVVLSAVIAAGSLLKGFKNR